MGVLCVGAVMSVIGGSTLVGGGWSSVPWFFIPRLLPLSPIGPNEGWNKNHRPLLNHEQIMAFHFLPGSPCKS